MTNEYKAGKLSIIKCDQCRDGYLIIKPSQKEDYFLGCTNYKPNGTGCNRTMTKGYYYKIMNYPDDPASFAADADDTLPLPPEPTAAPRSTAYAIPELLPVIIEKAVISAKDPMIESANELLL